MIHNNIKNTRTWTKIIFCLSVLFYFTLGAKKRTSYPLWEHLELKQEHRSQSFLFSLSERDRKPSKETKKTKGEKDYSQEFIQDIYDIIHARQNPTREDCKRQRLLAIQMSATSFEGTGSLLKQIMISTAIAVHSNCTLVWGLGLPFPFEVTRELWNGRANDDIVINNEHLNCSQHDITFGPLGCFFEPISTCSLEDAGPAEIIEFSHNPYNDSARITMAEMRKGVAMYHPPMGLLDFIWSKGKYPDSAKTQLIQHQAYLWSAAVTAYVFRIKPSLIQSFQQRFDPLFDGTDLMWGLHIRHGDLKALSNVYSYKEIFDFEDYFDAAIKMSQKQKFTPKKIFIATDSIEADNIDKLYEKYIKNREESGNGKKSGVCRPGQVCNNNLKKNKKKNAFFQGEGDEDEDEIIKEILREERRGSRQKSSDEDDEDYDEEEEDDEDYDEDEDEEEDDEEDDYEEEDEDDPDELKRLLNDPWYGRKAPKFVTVSNQHRYRTEHGSHTVAANGGCFRDENYEKKGMRCALNYEAIIHYQTIEEHRAIPRPYRMLRVYLESIEDLYILSRCQAIIAQGSSHYSTLAALLQVAAHGTRHIEQRIDYLDQKTINSGITPTAYLHGMNMLNGTNAIDGTKLTSGSQRWIVHTNHFISGLPEKDFPRIKLTFNPWSVDYRIHIENGLPHINDQLFYLEARTWLGFSPKYKPTLPGHCPGMIKDSQNPVQYIAEVINLGVEHLQFSHNAQAMQCWSDALHAISKYPQASNPQHMEEMRSVASGNMQTMRILRYSEMIVNELKTIQDYYIFTDKYMKQAYDRGIDDSTKAAAKNKPMSLEEVNERIVELESELKTLRNLREKLIKAHESYMNNNYRFDGLENMKALP